MTDHADTIRRNVHVYQHEFPGSSPYSTRSLPVVLKQEYDRCEAERQQAIDALREIATLMPGTHCGEIARAALVSLGEQS